jgi:hypothetical protein
MKSESSQASYAPSAELLAARDAVEAARQRSARVREQVDATAMQITALEGEVHKLQTDLANREAERALADDGAAKKLDAEIKRLAGDLDSKSRELNRARNLLQALETKAPEIDEEVRAAGTVLQSEQGIWASNAAQALRNELQEAVRPLVRVMARARAVGGPELRDFLSAALVPDPEGFMRFPVSGGGWVNQGTNLLDAPPDEIGAAAARAISENLKPVRESLAAVRSHGDYVPLAKRPKPYVRKGRTTEGVKGDARPFGAADAPPKPARALDTRSPSTATSRTGHVGDLPPGTPLEGDIAYAQTQEFLRANPIA